MEANERNNNRIAGGDAGAGAGDSTDESNGDSRTEGLLSATGGSESTQGERSGANANGLSIRGTGNGAKYSAKGKRLGRPPGSGKRRGVNSGAGAGAGGNSDSGYGAGIRDSETQETGKPLIIDVGVIPTKGKRGRPKKSSSGGLSEEFVRRMVVTGFGIIGAMRPRLNKEALPDLWDIEDGEAKTISEPLTRMAERLPERYSVMLENVWDPVILCIALRSSIVDRMELEKRVINEIRQTNQRGITDIGQKGRGTKSSKDSNSQGNNGTNAGRVYSSDDDAIIAVRL